MISIRAFRAIDDLEACQKFVIGHRHVLENIGVKKVTSSKDEWMYNPGAFVIIVESLDGEKVYGGARVEVAGGSVKLPIEEATGYLDTRIYDVVKEYTPTCTTCQYLEFPDYNEFPVLSFLMSRSLSVSAASVIP